MDKLLIQKRKNRFVAKSGLESMEQARTLSSLMEDLRIYIIFGLSFTWAWRSGIPSFLIDLVF